MMSSELSRVMQLLAALWPLLLIGGCLLGCNSIPSAFPREFAIASQQIAASAVDQAVWSNIVANLEGEVIEPGIRTGGGFEYFAYSRLTGTSGRVGLRTEGAGGGALTDEGRAAVLAIADQYRLTPEQVTALLAALRGTPAPAAPSPMEPVRP